MKYDNWKISVSDCNKAMVVKSVNNDINQKYKPSLLAFIPATDFFTLLDPVNCPITRCEVLAQGC